LVILIVLVVLALRFGAGSWEGFAMATLKLDIADPEQARRFPRHGWSRNSQGVRLLWLPVLRLLRNIEVIRKERGAKPASPSNLADALSVEESLRYFALVLRELRYLDRTTPKYSLEDPRAHPQQMDRLISLTPVYVDMALTYLRRLSFLLAAAMRMLIVNDYDNVSWRNFSQFREDVLEPNKLEGLQPICDLEVLRAAFRQHTGWFDLVTSGVKQGKKGVRASLEHRPTRLLVSQSEVEGSWSVHVSLHSTHRDVPEGDLLPLLAPNISDFCENLAGITQAVGWGNQYDALEVLAITGEDEDRTYYWPSI
jgi:hypothetical protein